jgi:hypothetical protein
VRNACFTLFGVSILLIAPLAAQTSEKDSNVKINYLNVCTPPAEDQMELRAALERIPQHPHFSPDFEIARGRTSMSDAPMSALGLPSSPDSSTSTKPEPSRWVRLRKDFPQDDPFVSVQYSISVGSAGVTETLVWRARDVKNEIQTSLEDSVSAASDPRQVLRTDTPVDRIRVERFGKPSVVLARCPSADQSAYAPLFTEASAILEHYRSILNVRGGVIADLDRVGGLTSSKPASRAAPPKKQGAR